MKTLLTIAIPFCLLPYVAAGQTRVSETMIDRCSAETIISKAYQTPSPFEATGVFLKRQQNGWTDWSPPIPVNGRTYIRWWCHSTTGNWADPGTWRIKGGTVGIGCKSDWDRGELRDCRPTASIDIRTHDVQGWTEERSRCASRNTRAISARLGPNRLLEIRCLE
jgi:hypothetical protein